MNQQKLCELYNSDTPASGQAHDITLTSQMNGWKELSFTVPYAIDGEKNWRIDYLRGEHLVRVIIDGDVDWYILDSPAQSHKGLTASCTVTCSHLSSLLNKKNLFLYFDDENGIGTAQELLGKALAGTGWTLGFCETFLERDGTAEKIRSLKADGKRGAYLLISDICELFQGYLFA